MSYESKISVALGSVDSYAQNRFFKFVSSPYFNVNAKLIRYCDVIIDLVRSNSSLSKTELWNKIPMDGEYEDKRFRKLNNDLLVLFEEFLTIEEFKSERLNGPNFLLQFLTKNKIEKLNASSLKKAFRLSERSLEKSGDYYYQQYRLQNNIFNLISDFERENFKHDEETNLHAINQNLDIFYFTEKLKHYATQLTWKRIRKSDFEVSYIKDVLKMIESKEIDEYLPIRTYLTIVNSILEPEVKEHYFELKEIVQAHLDSFPPKEAKDIFNSALNYCISKANKGEQSYTIEILDLYREGLRSATIFEGDFLNPNTLRNVTTYALRLQEFDYAESFIEESSEFIEPEIRQSIVSYNKALLAFYKKQYDEVILYLRDYNYEGIHYSLGAKSILLATYYELDEYNVLDTFLSTFKTYLNRKKRIPESRRKNYLNLVKWTQKLINLHNYSKKDLEKLEEQIQNSPVASKAWLLEKLREL